MKLCYLSPSDSISVFALLISIFALVATLRKKDFGTFYFVPLLEEKYKNCVWLKLIKSDVYDITIIIEKSVNLNCRLEFYNPDTDKVEIVAFLDNNNNNCKIGHLKANTILKFTHCGSNKISFTYNDKYNNKYTQSVKENILKRRFHINFYNLSFVGS